MLATSQTDHMADSSSLFRPIFIVRIFEANDLLWLALAKAPEADDVNERVLCTSLSLACLTGVGQGGSRASWQRSEPHQDKAIC